MGHGKRISDNTRLKLDDTTNFKKTLEYYKLDKAYRLIIYDTKVTDSNNIATFTLRDNVDGPKFMISTSYRLYSPSTSTLIEAGSDGSISREFRELSKYTDIKLPSFKEYTENEYDKELKEKLSYGNEIF